MTARTCYATINDSDDVHFASTLEGAYAQRDGEPDSAHAIFAVTQAHREGKCTAEQLRAESAEPDSGVRQVCYSSKQYLMRPVPNPNEFGIGTGYR